MFVTDNSMEKLAKESDELLKAMITDSTFAPLLSQTAESLPIVRDEWERNCVKTSEWVAGMTGLEFSKDVPVYLTHPKIKQGHAGRDCIFWAHRLTWPNYNTVYLWHEYLHLAIPGGDLEHAVIQLITDNELKIRLNGGSYPPFEGHEYLFKLMQLLLPEWQQYLKGTENRNIKNFIAKAASQRSIKEELIACEKHRRHASEN